MFKHILLLALMSSSIISKSDSSVLAKLQQMSVKFIAKLQQMDEIQQLVKQKEKAIDKLNDENAKLFDCLDYGLNTDQRRFIYEESNKFEQKLTLALNNNQELDSLLRETLCPDIDLHRNEINRMKNIVIRVCIEYFILHQLWAQYTDIAIDAFKIQYEYKKTK